MSKKARLLVVDDDPESLELLKAVFSENGYEVITAINGVDAFSKIKDTEPDIIISDLQMPEVDGLGLLELVAEHYPQIAFILITAEGSIETAVAAMKNGAKDYILKPLRLDEVLKKISNLAEFQSLKKENEYLRSKLEDRFHFNNIIGKNRKMQQLYSLIGDISDTAATVLIRGESGTGKELIANAIHFNSDRVKKPFVKVNCAVLSENLLESELFGHIKGSFTGAVKDKIGRFEQADGGTFFMDEIGDISLNMQVKLLRVLQEGEFERVGDLQTKKVNVRIIAATSRNLEKMMEEGIFRKDLYYRLNVIPLVVPPLRERIDDVPLLANYFLDKFASRFNKNIKSLASDALKAFEKYSWHGNIRELENVLERTMLLSKSDIISIKDLPENIISEIEGKQEFIQPDFSDGYSLIDQVDIFEKKLIENALSKNAGNKQKTAALLGIHRSTFMSKLKKYGIN
jgi:two-component system response regulator AtoC